MSSTKKLTVRCPDCQSELTIDAATGAILGHRKPKEPLAGGQTFESLFAELDAGKARAEDLFERSKAEFEDKDRILEEKFREALKRAEENPDEKPHRPFDMD